MLKKLWLKIFKLASRFFKLQPKLIDIGAKLLEINIEKVNIEFAKEKNTVEIEMHDESKHIHFHNEIGLSPDDIFSMSAEDLGNFIKQKTILTVKSAFKNNPKEMNKYLATYNPMVMATGASWIVTQNLAHLYETNEPYPSGDFVKELPTAISDIVIDFIKVDENANLKIIDIKPNENNT